MKLKLETKRLTIDIRNDDIEIYLTIYKKEISIIIEKQSYGLQDLFE